MILTEIMIFLLHVKQSRSYVFMNALLFGYTLEGIDLCAENTMVNPVFQSERDGKQESK